MTTTEASDQEARRLFSVLLAKDDNGAFVYSDDDVLGFAALMIREVPVEQHTPAMGQLTLQLAHRAGVTPTTTPAEMTSLVQAFVDRHPPAALLSAFHLAVREGKATTTTLVNALAEFSGAPRSLEGLKPGAAKPEMSRLSVLLAARTTPKAEEDT